MNVLRSHLVSLLASEQAKGDRDLTLVASALFSVVPKYRTWEKKGVEDAFIKNQIAGSFDILLGQDNEDILQYEWSNKKLSNCILKPDYTLFFYDEQESPVEVFVTEVKAPLRNKNSNDFIKLGFTLKSMLDGAIKRGMTKPHMLGLLVDGYNCYLYMMKIEHEAIYQMVELDTFSLPKGRNEIHLLKNLLEVIFRVKAFASEAFEDFEASNGAQSELLPLCRFVAE
ncbi:hypothetical protein EDC96DRAFT_529181 [Choanephora cucurbitarum]|nr:hypothetical protein EDC96DRAFT_538409 [Choanephora cucurbitarum]KAI8329783.1 hypothetical protein EDC96DRAFT_529181 [Choanephora cucurbitarum]